MAAKCASPAPPLGEKHIFENQTVKLGKQINGIDRKTCAMVKLYAAGKMPVNFLEVMACPGGCQNGPCSLA